MTKPPAGPAKLLEEPRNALKLALGSQAWAAGVDSEVSVRLAGGRIDGKARLVTDLLVLPGTASLTTRLPILIPTRYRHEASLLCSSLNAAGPGVASIDPDGVPVLFSKLFLLNPEEFAAATIVDGIRQHRLLAEMVSPAFIHIARGESAASIAVKLGLMEPLPFTQPTPAATTLDLSHTPEAPPELLAQRPPLTTEAEWLAIARVEALNRRLPGDAPMCAGLLVSHADGVLECHGCTNPTARIHVAGGSASCRPERRLGPGHLCSRCDPP